MVPHNVKPCSNKHLLKSKINLANFLAFEFDVGIFLENKKFQVSSGRGNRQIVYFNLIAEFEY